MRRAIKEKERIEAMRTQDAVNREKVEKKQPRNRVRATNEEQDGILRVSDEFARQWGDKRMIQEQHNSGHALWFLAMSAYSVIRGKRGWLERSKTERIIIHLYCLSEFIPNEDIKFRVTTRRLIHVLEQKFPRKGSEWAIFFRDYWHLIRQFAERYGDHDKCFPLAYYPMIEDRTRGLHYFKAWWWLLAAEKVRNFISRRMLSMSRLGAKIEKSGGLS